MENVCFYQITSKSNNKEKIDIINVYAPTNILESSKPEELEEFYINFKSCMKNLKSNIWFIGGDFNSKIGKNKSSTQGGHNKDCQNNNGSILEEFVQENNHFASNTAFKKQSKKKNTWVGHLRGKTIYNVIDFNLIELLLTNTTLAIRYNKKTCKSFTTNIGCPQGNALSPVLFTVYLKACMK